MGGDGQIVTTLNETDWDRLIKRIKIGQVTPFLGAGMSSAKIPLGGDIAQQMADDPQFNYPLPDKRDLIKVAQYIALTVDAGTPKEIIQDIIAKAGYPDFSQQGEPHVALARLPLPLYMTTNYDDFMFQALKKVDGKDPQLFINRWYEAGVPKPPPKPGNGDANDIYATVEKPAVYHFHGHKDHLETMVLTEDDYLDFLVRVSRDQELIPPRVRQAIGGTSLLFIGYSLSDTNFRVLFRGLVQDNKSAQKISVTVQINPGEPRVAAYLTKYFGVSGIRVYWGTAQEFAAELAKRWEAAQ